MRSKIQTSRHGVAPGRSWRALTRALLSCLLLLGLAASLAGCGDKIELQSALNDVDANEIISALNSHGIGAQKIPSKEGMTVVIDADNLSRATDVLRAAGLPRKNRANLGEIFKKEGMISTPLEERVRYIYGLSEELENTLQQFDHVISARVHVVLPERIAPGEPIQPSSAAVFIKYQAPFDEDTLMPRIRALVAASIPGLSGEQGLAKVSVVLIPAETAVNTIEWEKIGPFRLQKGSAGMFVVALLVMAVLALGGLALLLIPLARGNTKLRGLIKWKPRKNAGEAGKPQEAGT